MINKLGLILLIANLIVPSLLNAKDFGVSGHTYEIAEEDIIEFIKKKLASADLNKINEDMKERTRQYIERPPQVEGIIQAKEDKVFYYDPTYTLDRDIIDHKGTVIHFKGKKVNPLEYIPLREALLFIDGDNERHIKLALEERKKRVGKIKIILTKGSPIELQRKHKIWIYFDQGGLITKKFGIKEIPATVEQEGLKLRISIIGEANK
ncbi:type-F conjugative transfer system protein TraW [Candidatus Jidaibacter acanthamoebae]|uniref:type-F conjugative transfer system protein TraW n=1 Tax=Candidatus Jidaibacter acanthamoebae TaxID=86105 RepID=UPI00057D2A2B|nr:type-F conjugative transfer system protein TraW [Candidatus Jidaibacter acanthamoeba]